MTPVDSIEYKAAAKAIEASFGKAHTCSWWWKYSYYCFV
jgi:hypothetical protein